MDLLPTRHSRIGCPDGVNSIRHTEVSILCIGLTHVYYLSYFSYLQLLIIHIVTLDKLRDLLLYFSLCVMCCILAELLYIR